MAQLTSAQIAAMQASAAGNVQLPGAPQLPGQVFQTYPGCGMDGNVGQTQASVPMDPSRFNRDQCGYFTVYIDRSPTSQSGDRMWTIGGSMANTSDAAVVRELYNFGAAVNFLFDLDADVIGPNSANLNAQAFTAFMDNIVAGRNMVVAQIELEDDGSTGTTFTTVANQKIFKKSLQPWGDWNLIEPKLKADMCDPCFQDSTTHAIWRGFIPLTSQDAFALNIPAGFAGIFTFCVFEYENAPNMTRCASNV